MLQTWSPPLVVNVQIQHVAQSLNACGLSALGFNPISARVLPKLLTPLQTLIQPL